MRKSTLLLLTLLLGFLPALAQQVVTGTVVTAPDNEAAIGASIIVKEHSKVGTTVGLDGAASRSRYPQALRPCASPTLVTSPKRCLSRTR